MKDLTETLAAWKATTDAASIGPWSANKTAWGMTVEQGSTDEMIFAETSGITWTPNSGDAEFIAQSRTIVPALLSAVEGVLAVHKKVMLRVQTYAFPPDAMYVELPFCSYCKHAGDARRPWPCPTVKALTDALGADS